MHTVEFKGYTWWLREKNDKFQILTRSITPSEVAEIYERYENAQESEEDWYMSKPTVQVGDVIYTILDFTRMVYGPVNLIGGGWDKHMTDAACRNLMQGLMSGEVEVSHRNSLVLREGDVK